jgi:hypothetical protein
VKRQKYSEMVLNVAWDFISGGGTPEERQNRLTSACTAWNYACVPVDVRTKLLDEWVAGYRKWNPGAEGDECRGVREVMERLIQRKPEKYPHVVRQILSCELKVVDGRDHVFVATADQELPPRGLGVPAS